jgi:phosphoglycolate phosphatase
LIKVVTFDFDGTLFDTRQDITDAVNHARQEFELSLHSVEAVTSMVGFGVQVLAQKAFADSNIDAATALPVIMEYYEAHPGDRATPYPGVMETLPRVDAIRTIVSNKPEGLVWAMLRDHEMGELFEFVAGGDTFSAKKPDPFPVKFLQARYNLAPEEILVVGDHSPDIEMARTAGCRSIFCRYGFVGRDPVGADFQIDAFPEILGILDQLNQSDQDSSFNA